MVDDAASSEFEEVGSTGPLPAAAAALAQCSPSPRASRSIEQSESLADRDPPREVGDAGSQRAKAASATSVRSVSGNVAALLDGSTVSFSLTPPRPQARQRQSAAEELLTGSTPASSPRTTASTMQGDDADIRCLELLDTAPEHTFESTGEYLLKRAGSSSGRVGPLDSELSLASDIVQTRAAASAVSPEEWQRASDSKLRDVRSRSATIGQGADAKGRRCTAQRSEHMSKSQLHAQSAQSALQSVEQLAPAAMQTLAAKDTALAAGKRSSSELGRADDDSAAMPPQLSPCAVRLPELQLTNDWRSLTGATSTLQQHSLETSAVQAPEMRYLCGVAFETTVGGGFGLPSSPSDSSSDDAHAGAVECVPAQQQDRAGAPTKSPSNAHSLGVNAPQTLQPPVRDQAIQAQKAACLGLLELEQRDRRGTNDQLIKAVTMPDAAMQEAQDAQTLSDRVRSQEAMVPALLYQDDYRPSRKPIVHHGHFESLSRVIGGCTACLALTLCHTQTRALDETQSSVFQRSGRVQVVALRGEARILSAQLTSSQHARQLAEGKLLSMGAALQRALDLLDTLGGSDAQGTGRATRVIRQQRDQAVHTAHRLRMRLAATEVSATQHTRLCAQLASQLQVCMRSVHLHACETRELQLFGATPLSCLHLAKHMTRCVSTCRILIRSAAAIELLWIRRRRRCTRKHGRGLRRRLEISLSMAGCGCMRAWRRSKYNGSAALCAARQRCQRHSAIHNSTIDADSSWRRSRECASTTRTAARIPLR